MLRLQYEMIVIMPSWMLNPGASGHQVALDAGDITEIRVFVTAEDATASETYTVMVYRENLPLSDDASLDTAATGR